MFFLTIPKEKIQLEKIKIFFDQKYEQFFKRVVEDSLHSKQFRKGKFLRINFSKEKSFALPLIREEELGHTKKVL